MLTLTDKLTQAIFQHRLTLIVFFLLMTILMLWSACSLRIDVGFNKFLPLEHEYINTYLEYRKDFGGANKILIALKQKEGDIFSKEFFSALKDITDTVFFIDGVERSSVKSLYTPNVRFTEVVEDGISGGNIIPNDFKPRSENFEQVRRNIQKSNYLGRLVAHDFTASLISADLQDINPSTGEKRDALLIAKQLEEEIRQQYPSEKYSFTVHIIGFAKVMGDIADGAQQVLLFFIIAFLITAVFVYLYTQSIQHTGIVICCALIAVIWQLGLLTHLGYGIDPILILIPFLIFAIAVSHGVQMISAYRAELFDDKDNITAASHSFRRLLLPGMIALLSDTIGFLCIMQIEIPVIQEMAINASLGVAMIILTNLVLLPVLLSFSRFNQQDSQRLHRRAEKHLAFCQFVANITERKSALIVLITAIAVLFGVWPLASSVRIGDLHQGVPELHQDSVYNQDTALITEHFSIGVDVLTVIAETRKEACVDYNIMKAIDDFSWAMQNIAGVQSVFSLPVVAKKINAGWNEGNPKWNALSRNTSVLAQSVAYVDTSSGLLNADCRVMPIHIFTKDHTAETIQGLTNAVKTYQSSHTYNDLQFRLASGNVGVMAASNEAVASSQLSMLAYVYTAITILCLITFRSIKACLCIVLPLAWVSVLAYALMSLFEIGLKTSTLPVAALGVGIGVDYGIYLFSRLQGQLRAGIGLQQAYLYTLKVSGSAVLFTGLTLATAVATWIFSPLKFQADMGILLTFMFLVNMLAAMTLIPALASFFYKGSSS